MRRWSATLFALLIAMATAYAPPMAEPAAAQDGWNVRGGEKRKKEIIRRYRVMLERRPVEGLPLRKLIEIVGKGDGLDRMIKDYESKAKAAPDKAKFQLILGHLYKAKNQYPEALKAYEAAIAIDSSSPTAYLGRGAALSMLKRNKEASADFNKALSLEKSKAKKQEILRKLADLAFAQRDWESAQGYYDKLVAINPRNEYLRMEYAQVLVKYKRYDKALGQYEALVKLAGRNVKARATTLRDMGDVYEKMGVDDKAISTYKRAMALVRSSNWLYRELQSRIVQIYRRQDRVAELVEDYRKKWRSPNYDQAMLLGELYDELGKEAEAMAMYKRAVSRNRREIKPRVRIIQILQRRGEEKKVIAGYKELIRVSPRAYRYHFDLAKIYFRNGDRKQAERLLSRARKRFRREPDVLVQLAETYMRFGMRKDALAVYKQLVRADPRNDSYIINLGEYYFQAGETEKAIATWKKVLKSSLPKPEANARLGEVLVEHNMVDSGIEYYEKALKLAKDDLDIKRGLAMAYERARRWEQAVSLWNDVLKKGAQPHVKSEARSRIITLYRRQQRLRTKLREFKEAFEGEPPSIEDGYFLAESYMRLGEYEKAERTFEAIIQSDGKVDKGDMEALVELEKVYMKAGRYKDAIDILQKLAKLKPAASKEYYHRIAELSLKAYEDKQAIEYATLAVEKNPDDATAHARLGAVYAKMKRYNDAVREYNVAIDLDPRAFKHYFELAELHIQMNHKDKAFKLYIITAQKAFDEAMILQASRKALALADTIKLLEELETDLSPMVYRSPPKPVYRRVMLEIYSRMTMPLIADYFYNVRADRTKLAKQLSQIGKRAYPVLMDAVQSEDIGQRAKAVRMLGELRQGNAALTLARMVEDKREQLRFEAAVAVAQIGDPRASKPLIRAMDDSEGPIRELATWALGAGADDKARKKLLSVLGDGQSHNQKILAAISLGRVGNEKSRAQLIEQLKSNTRSRWADNHSQAMIWALGRIGSSKSVPLLRQILFEGNAQAAQLSAWALAEIGGNDAFEALLAAYWSGGDGLQTRSLRGLYQLARVERTERGERQESRQREILYEGRFIVPRSRQFRVDALITKLRSSSQLEPAPLWPLLNTHRNNVIAVAKRSLAGEPSARVALLSDLAGQDGIFFRRASHVDGLHGKAKKVDSAETLWRKTIEAIAPKLRTIVTGQSSDAERAPAIELLSALGASGDSAAIIGHAEHSNPQIRQAVTFGLRFYGGKNVVRALIGRLKDRNHLVRARAAASLSDQKGLSAAQKRAASEKLAGLLQDNYMVVQLEAIEALGQMGQSGSAAALIKKLEASRVVKVAALRALAKLPGNAASAAVAPYRASADLELRQAASGK